MENIGVWTTLVDEVILLAGALLLGVLFERLRQSAILGYLAAGALLGPGGLNLISSKQVVLAMAELGVALLLFTIGLEFSWNRLRRLGSIALLGGTIQIVATGFATAAICLALGLKLSTAIAFGAMIGPSSTACVLRMLTERAELESVHGRNSLGILLLQDIALVPLVLLVTMLGGEGTMSQVLWGVGRALLFAVTFVALFYLLNIQILPKLLHVTAESKNRELPILLATVMFLGSAWAAHALSLSPALGAFVAGLLLAESPFATQVRADVGSLRTLFVTIFFASIGMLADFHFIRNHWMAVIGVVGMITVGKALIIWPIARLFGNSNRHSVATGICLAQVGEFSFLLSQTALSREIISNELFRLIVSATVGTLFLTPYLVAAAPRVALWLERRLLRLEVAEGEESERPYITKSLVDHVIIVGLGPAGRGVMEALHRANVPVVVADLNPRSVSSARREGIHAEVGDASQEELLEHLQVSSARVVVVTIPDYRTAIQIVRLVRSMSPKAIVLARARYHIYARDLQHAGAHVVVDEEQGIGQLLENEVIKHLRSGSG